VGNKGSNGGIDTTKSGSFNVTVPYNYPCYLTFYNLNSEALIFTVNGTNMGGGVDITKLTYPNTITNVYQTKTFSMAQTDNMIFALLGNNSTLSVNTTMTVSWTVATSQGLSEADELRMRLVEENNDLDRGRRYIEYIENRQRQGGRVY
jgi:hypothetical protein